MSQPLTQLITALAEGSAEVVDLSIPLGPACVIDVTRECAADNDFLLTPEGIVGWEASYGRIPKGAWVLLRTDWSRRSGAAFLNADGDGPHTPGFHQRASAFLAKGSSW